MAPVAKQHNPPPQERRELLVAPVAAQRSFHSFMDYSANNAKCIASLPLSQCTHAIAMRLRESPAALHAPHDWSVAVLCGFHASLGATSIRAHAAALRGASMRTKQASVRSQNRLCADRESDRR